MSGAESTVSLLPGPGGWQTPAWRAHGAAASVQTNTQGTHLKVAITPGERWPGIDLVPREAPWDLSAYRAIRIHVRNPGNSTAAISCRVDNAGADGVNACVTASKALPPGQTQRWDVELKRVSWSDTRGGKLFGMRGYPPAIGGPGTIDPSRITQILLFATEPKSPLAFEVSQIEAIGASAELPPIPQEAELFPFIDTFGQYRHRDWPGKTHSIEQLAQSRDTETRALEAAGTPAGWNRYGAWEAGPQFEATGFFRTHKLNGKWWLIDPTGRLFFSQGVDCVRMTEVTPIAERETWFEAFPGRNEPFTQFVSEAFCLKGHYAGKRVQSFSFGGANLLRKYGPEWQTIYRPVVHQRLRTWGFNTIGMWSEEATRLLRATPYVDAASSGGSVLIEGSEGYWGKFPDPFHPGFRSRLDQSMAQKEGKAAGDPWCLGFFADNELSWGDEYSLAVAALKSTPDQPAKQRFIKQLQQKYERIDALNSAWGTAHADWEALRQTRSAPDPSKAGADLGAFYSQIADEYFRTVRAAIKAVAPNQLYLGCRFAWTNPRAAASAAQFCDVVSFNLYRTSVADFQYNGGRDVPLIIGEFHFGALDRGMFHTGLVPTGSQAERAETYRNYVSGALDHPSFVGCHWFQYQDQPTTGRTYDGENYQIGLVDIADTPHPELIQVVRKLADELYTRRFGPK